MDSNSKPVDHPSRETVEVRQGTGPRATVSVLLISVALAVIEALDLRSLLCLLADDWARAAALALARTV